MEEMKISQNENEYFTIIPIEEWEKILNKYIPIMYKLSKELTEIKTSINFSDELSKVYLDFQRNEYMYTNLKISLLALSCSLTSVITGKLEHLLQTNIYYKFRYIWYESAIRDGTRPYCVVHSHIRHCSANNTMGNK